MIQKASSIGGFLYTNTPLYRCGIIGIVYIYIWYPLYTFAYIDRDKPPYISFPSICTQTLHQALQTSIYQFPSIFTQTLHHKPPHISSLPYLPKPYTKPNKPPHISFPSVCTQTLTKPNKPPHISSLPYVPKPYTKPNKPPYISSLPYLLQTLQQA